MRSHRCWNAATSARQTTGAPTATLCDWGSARRRNRSAETCCPLSPKELKLCPTGKCQATFANHHRLKGERLDFRRAETLIRINVSQEGGRNPWESGHGQVSWPTPHPLLEVQKKPLTNTAKLRCTFRERLCCGEFLRVICSLHTSGKFGFMAPCNSSGSFSFMVPCNSSGRPSSYSGQQQSCSSEAAFVQLGRKSSFLFPQTRSRVPQRTSQGLNFCWERFSAH